MTCYLLLIPRGLLRGASLESLSEDSYEAYLAVHEKYMQRMEAVAQSTGTPVLRTRQRLEYPKEKAFSGLDMMHTNKRGM